MAITDGESGCSLARLQFEGTSEEKVRKVKGLFYKIDDGNAHLDIELELLDTGRRSTGELSISALQQWAEKGWKKEHNTAPALEYWRSKFGEECTELGEAIDTGNPRAILGEAGDVVVCLLAIADNDSIVLDPYIKDELYAYARGVNLLAGDHPRELPWKTEAMRLSTQTDRLTVKDVEGIIMAGFVPFVVHSIDLKGEDDTMSVREAAGTLGILAHVVWAGARHRTHEGEDNFDPDIRLSNTTLGDVELGHLVARALLSIAYLVHLYGYSFEECMEVTMSKINARIQAGRIGKEDGERSGDLL